MVITKSLKTLLYSLILGFSTFAHLTYAPAGQAPEKNASGKRTREDKDDKDTNKDPSKKPKLNNQSKNNSNENNQSKNNSNENKDDSSSKSKRKLNPNENSDESDKPSKKQKTMVTIAQVYEFIKDQLEKNNDRLTCVLSVLMEYKSAQNDDDNLLILEENFITELLEYCMTQQPTIDYCRYNALELDEFVRSGILLAGMQKVATKYKSANISQEEYVEILQKDPDTMQLIKAAFQLRWNNIPSYVFELLARNRFDDDHFAYHPSQKCLIKNPKQYFVSVTALDIVATLLHVMHYITACNTEFNVNIKSSEIVDGMIFSQEMMKQNQMNQMRQSGNE